MCSTDHLQSWGLRHQMAIRADFVLLSMVEFLSGKATIYFSKLYFHKQPTAASALVTCGHGCLDMHVVGDVAWTSYRDRRIEREEINEGAIFRPGAYVYMGKRTETEW